MKEQSVRVRFAPAPTGMMHLGNVRAALMNYLFAQQKKGVFIVRVEDTDQQRNYDPQATEIMRDLSWLRIIHDEGPGVEGAYGPYFQSQRVLLYQEKLQELIAKGLIYRCFCSEELLEKKRKRQIALKEPPRYDRTCCALDHDVIQNYLVNKTPSVWRFMLDRDKKVKVHDLAHGITTFELKHFSDFPLTRSDGSFTFIFANFVDDMLMQITHIFRGEDHLTNSACQAPLFEAFNCVQPIYWHMPILCNIEGKKLSKRDFGFSLRDLQEAGFLPEAITNYLAIIGGSFVKEIMTMDELIRTINFDTMHTTGHIKYDVEKLRWINRKLISAYDPEKLMQLCLPFLQAVYPTVRTMNAAVLINLLHMIKTDMVTLADSVQALAFYFVPVHLTREQLLLHVTFEYSHALVAVIENCFVQSQQCTDEASYIACMKEDAQKQSIPLKELYSFVRMALTGLPTGPALVELITMLGIEESKQRCTKAINIFRSV